MHIAADQHHVARRAGADERVDQLQPVGESGALLPNVERRSGRQPRLVLDQRAGPRNVVVRSHGGADQVVDLVRRHPRVGERGDHGLGAEVGRGDASLDVAPFPNPAALDDPGVVGVHHPRQGVVVADARRQRHARPGEDGARTAHR